MLGFHERDLDAIDQFVGVDLWFVLVRFVVSLLPLLRLVDLVGIGALSVPLLLFVDILDAKIVTGKVR